MPDTAIVTYSLLDRLGIKVRTSDFRECDRHSITVVQEARRQEAEGFYEYCLYSKPFNQCPTG
ncbi:MAG TPA: hypothetical protein V6D35_03290 [Candidatus Sericytochromatia bacterium]